MEIRKKLVKSSVDWTDRDYALFFGFIPLVLVLFYLLPTNLQDQLILKPLEATILSTFFSNYLHNDLGHLAGNMSSYLVVMLLLFNLETDKRRFYAVSFAILTILPLISSLYTISLLRRVASNSLGFSALAAAFLAYLVYDLYAFVKQNYYPQLTRNFLWLLLMLNVLVWSISWGNYEYLLFSSILVVIFLCSNHHAITETLLKIRPIISQPLKKSLLAHGFFCLTIVLAVFGLQILLTRDFASQGQLKINILAHHVGYVFGIISPLLYDIFVKIRE